MVVLLVYYPHRCSAALVVTIAVWSGVE
jgi:hypothetical protein